MEPKQQVWVSWSAAAPLIVNMEVVPISSTQKMSQVITQFRDTNRKNRLGKTANMHVTVVLGAILYKEG